jgi:phage shock protein PspC (stress-responsive transcriptional regulator)
MNDVLTNSSPTTPEPSAPTTSVPPAPEAPIAPPMAPIAAPAPTPSPRFRLVLSRTDRKLGGVCGGLATTFDIDSTLVRIAFVGAAFAGFGIPLYLAAWLLAPKEPVNA